MLTVGTFEIVYFSRVRRDLLTGWIMTSMMLLGLCSTSAQDMTFSLPHTHYTVANGLPQMQVRAVFLDEDGLVWLGTQGGLAVFDGSAVHTLQDTGLLAEAYVQSITRGSEGVFVSTLSGTHVFDGDQSARIDLDDGGRSYLLFEDRYGRL